MGRQNIVDILCRRDGISEEDANDLIEEVLSLMDDCEYDPDECESIMAMELGLEPDYFIDLL